MDTECELQTWSFDWVLELWTANGRGWLKMTVLNMEVLIGRLLLHMTFFDPAFVQQQLVWYPFTCSRPISFVFVLCSA